MTAQNKKSSPSLARIVDALTVGGFLFYAVAAPHSIAISWVGISLLVLGWLLQIVITRKLGIQRTLMDLPLLLFIGWTVISSVLSIEPRDSIPKLINASTFLFFYLTQSLLTRKLAIFVAGVLILSAAAGVLWGAGELILGRGVIVSALAADSPLRKSTALTEGDVIWRVNNHRVASVEEINDAIKQTCSGCAFRLSVISRGEHAEWTSELPYQRLDETNPSGITGGGRTHRFRASGWTRHYETFAETLQIIAQFGFGFAIAFWKRRKDKDSAPRNRRRAVLATLGLVVVAAGIPLTAMRSTLTAFAVGTLVIGWRTANTKRQKAIVAAAIAVIIVIGGVFVWRTRESGALALRDPSANLRLHVATIAARRVVLHPIFGHGMDAMHEHWNEWGFPGRDMLDAHSTPIQIAFDRGLPALAFWFWLMFSFWRFATRTELTATRTNDAAAHGLSIGIIGALAGFFVSSLVNYNFGDSEVALLLWWMMGAAVVLLRESERSAPARA